MSNHYSSDSLYLDIIRFFASDYHQFPQVLLLFHGNDYIRGHPDPTAQNKVFSHPRKRYTDSLLVSSHISFHFIIFYYPGGGPELQPLLSYVTICAINPSNIMPQTVRIKDALTLPVLSEAVPGDRIDHNTATIGPPNIRTQLNLFTSFFILSSPFSSSNMS